jgi:hypothetical protein
MTGNEPEPGGGASSWADVVRRAPTGILVLAALLALMGAALLVAGIYLVLAGESGWFGGVMIAVGPLMVYVAGQFVQFVRWAGMVVGVLIVLMLISSVIRVIAESGLPGAAVAEIVVELGWLAYLARPRIRSLFAIA